MNISKREFKNGDRLSLVGFGGMLCVGRSPRDIAALIGEAVDRGVNYFDVAPSYGNGEAEEKLGPAIEPYRPGIFLACKTMRRDGDGAREELERSLRRLQTDHVDLYQLHAVTTVREVEEILRNDGALETIVRSREQGLVRYIGFSAHSEAAALALMEQFPFDSVLFPFNVVCVQQGNFGPLVMQQAKARGIARLALKAMAHTPRPENDRHPWPNCWYKPIDDPELARLALRFTLSEDITAALPPGEEALFRLALDAAAQFTPLSSHERADLYEQISGAQPLFST
jgi:aryl-alcohol dehydrogenase-like predicted oxidoreductase